jgi:uncharacterized Zn finger protein
VTRENVQVKGRRYLCEARVHVVNVTGHTVTAAVRGGGAVYRTTHDRRLGWRCSCPARGECAHIVAVALVTVVRDDITTEGVVRDR